MADNGEAGRQGQPTRRAFPKAFVWLIRQPLRCRRGARRTHTPRPIVRDHERLGLWAPAQGRERINQVFSSDLIRLSNSSNEVSPLILSPLMKKVGVESTFSTSLAYF